MIEQSLKRIVEIYKNKEWVRIEFKNLEIGDRCRMFESDGSPVADGEFEVVSNPCIISGVLQVNVK